jgi:hypothetical protein
MQDIKLVFNALKLPHINKRTSVNIDQNMQDVKLVVNAMILFTFVTDPLIS